MILRDFEMYANSGLPLVGATVNLYAASMLQPTANAVLQSTTTNTQGMWEFTSIPEGDYDVEVVAPGVGDHHWRKGYSRASASAIAIANYTGPRKNRLINGDFRVGQRGGVGGAAGGLTVSDSSYTLDRWRALQETTLGSTVYQDFGAAPTNGGKFYAQLRVALANNKLGLWQSLEGVDIWDMRGDVASLQFWCRANNANITNVRAALVGWTGTEDAIGVDPINVWGADGTNPTYTAGWANLATLNVTASTTWAQYKIENVAVPANITNLAVFIWIDDKTTNAGDFLQIADVQLERGPLCTTFERRGGGHELLLCQRYYRVVAQGANMPFLTGYAATAGGRIYAGLTLTPEMRITPTPKITSGSHISVYYSGFTGVAVGNLTGIVGKDQRTVELDSVSALVAMTAGQSVVWFTNTAAAIFALDAEL